MLILEDKYYCKYRFKLKTDADYGTNKPVIGTITLLTLSFR